MISLSKLKSSAIEGKKRILTVLQFGAKTAKECGPFGFDSSAPEGWTAIYGETANRDEAVVLAYVNKEAAAELGGSRVFSLGESGELAAYVYCRTSGVLELNGAAFSAVRFQNLQTATNSANTLINTELTKIAAAINAIVPGSYTPASISTDLSTAESSDVKIK